MWMATKLIGRWFFLHKIWLVWIVDGVSNGTMRTGRDEWVWGTKWNGPSMCNHTILIIPIMTSLSECIWENICARMATMAHRFNRYGYQASQASHSIAQDREWLCCTNLSRSAHTSIIDWVVSALLVCFTRANKLKAKKKAKPSIIFIVVWLEPISVTVTTLQRCRFIIKYHAFRKCTHLLKTNWVYLII